MGKTRILVVFGLAILIHAANADSNSSFEERSMGNSGSEVSECIEGGCESRTFVGTGRRRMAVFFVPIMFKLGIIMTLLVGLTVMAFKSLTIGVMLLYFAFSSHKHNKYHGWHRAEEPPVHVHIHDEEEPSPPVHYYHPAPVKHHHHSSSWEKEPDQHYIPVKEEHYASRRVFNKTRAVPTHRRH